MQNDKDMAQYMAGQKDSQVRQVSPMGAGGGMATGGFGGISQQPPTVYGGGPGGGFDQAPI